MVLHSITARFSQNEHITRAIVEMVVLDYMPLKLVEGKGFLNLMSILAHVPRTFVPSEHIFSATGDRITRQ